jgi:cytochrome c553
MKWIVAIVTMFLLFGCSDQAKKDVKEVSEKVKNVDVQKVVEKTVEKTKETANDALVAVKNTEMGKVVEETTAKAKEIVTAAVAKGGDVTKNVKEDVVKALDSVQKSTLTSSVDGAALFASKCASCHGAKAEKAALGQSAIIAGWSSEKSVDAINGYKDGTYGKNMKMLMKGQVAALSDDEVAALANFISKQ